MEGSKNSMYEQAGRVRGWTVATEASKSKPPVAQSVTVKASASAQATASASISAPVPEHLPEIESDATPSPPVVVMPDMPASQPRQAYISEQPGTACEMPVMAFFNSQKWRDVYETEQGFARGTVFTELDLPFVGEGACKYE